MFSSTAAVYGDPPGGPYPPGGANDLVTRPMAIALESVLKHRTHAEQERMRGRRVGVLLTGSNVDTGVFARVLAG